jgi:hypothetical protein
MPQALLNTFLIGQEQSNSSGSEQQDTARPTIVEFRPAPALGASQGQPLSSTANVSSHLVNQSSLITTGLSETASVPIPSGAKLQPSLRSVFRGRGPTLLTRQLWEGTVTEVRNGGFIAVVNDKTDPTNPEEQVSFDLGDVSDEDHGLVTVGSPFYWVIGRERTQSGVVRNVSFVQFRRLPAWTASVLTRALDRAKRFKEISRAQE